MNGNIKNGIMQKAKNAAKPMMKKMNQIKDNIMGMMAMRKMTKKVKKLRKSLIK